MLGFLKDKLHSLKAKIGKAHKSLTIWFNGVVGTLTVVIPFAQDQWQSLHGMLGDAFYHGVVVILAIGNILLRFKTTKSLEHK